MQNIPHPPFNKRQSYDLWHRNTQIMPNTSRTITVVLLTTPKNGSRWLTPYHGAHRGPRPGCGCRWTTPGWRSRAQLCGHGCSEAWPCRPLQAKHNEHLLQCHWYDPINQSQEQHWKRNMILFSTNTRRWDTCYMGLSTHKTAWRVNIWSVTSKVYRKI